MSPGKKSADQLKAVLGAVSGIGDVNTTGKEELPTIIQCPLNYSMSDEKGEPLSGGEANGKIDAESLTVVPKLGEPLLVSLREISVLNAADYRLNITLSSLEQLSFFNLGHRYEDFVRELVHARNEVLLTDMLMYEKVLKKGVKATYSFFEGEQTAGNGPCEVRVYETGLVLLPETADPIRLPFSYVSGVADQDYRLTLATEQGRKLILSMMGREFDPLKKSIGDAMNALSLKAQATFKELVPLADPSMVRKASRYIRDGRAAMKRDLDAVSPQIWPDMEKKLAEAGVSEEYQFLKSVGQADRMCIGVKKGLPDDPTAEYVWYLVPAYDEGGKSGNALIMEAVSVSQDTNESVEAEAEQSPPEAEAAGQDSSAEAPASADAQKAIGKATYVFRIVSRNAYGSMCKADLDRATDEAIRNINDCMIAINFRREPIYISDEKLRESANLQYLYSVQRLPELRYLRDRYIGRIPHSGKDRWKKDLADILSFNAREQDDAAKWTKGR